jgi:hypothetical protein
MRTPLLHRQVLAAIGGTTIGRCIVDSDHGIHNLRMARCGGSNLDFRGKFGRKDRPWPADCGFDCTPEGLTVAPNGQAPFLVISWWQVTVVCTEVTATHRAVIAAHLDAARAKNAALPSYDSRWDMPAKRAYKATWDAHIVTWKRISADLEAAIDTALRLDAEQEPADLLELLAMGVPA